MTAEEYTCLHVALESDSENWIVRYSLANYCLSIGERERAVSLVTAAPIPPFEAEHVELVAELLGAPPSDTIAIRPLAPKGEARAAVAAYVTDRGEVPSIVDDVRLQVFMLMKQIKSVLWRLPQSLKKSGSVEVKKRQDKVSAIAIAVVVHAAILASLTAIIVAVPQNDPINIVAALSSRDVVTDVPPKTMFTKPTIQRESSAVALDREVISANMFSEMAMPSVDFAANPSPTIMGMGFEMGMMDFGLSFESGSKKAGALNIPPSMAGRCSMGQRMSRLKESGATTKCESAVRSALRFIASNQQEDGSFGKEYPAAMTGLAILAFLGHCETPDSPEFGDTVLKATMFLLERAGHSDHSNRAIMSEDGKPAYENAICTYALAELYTMTKARGAANRIPRLLSTVKQGVKATVDGQLESGGWDYGYRSGTGDSSVSGWQFQAMKAASNTGERFAKLDRAMDLAVEYFKFAQTPDGGTAYRPQTNRMKANRGLDGVGVLAMLMKGEEDAPEVERAFEGMEKRYLAEGASHSPHSYGWYYIMQAYFLKGGDEWKRWNQMAMDSVLETQAIDGSFKVNAGHGPKEPLTAAIYHTALCTLMLEVYYRYLPTTQK